LNGFGIPKASSINMASAFSRSGCMDNRFEKKQVIFSARKMPLALRCQDNGQTNSFNDDDSMDAFRALLVRWKSCSNKIV
jgi:hypothetical protein